MLGLSYENLGMGVARNWGFPDQLVQSMKQLPAGDALAGMPPDAPSLLEATALHEHAAILDASPGEAGGQAPRTTESVQSVLTAGLQDVSNSLIDDNMSVNDILRMILEAMYSGMGFAHVVLCIKDGRHNTMCGKFGFGDGVQRLIKAFDFPLAA